MRTSKWFFILFVSVSLLVFGSWVYRVHLIQSSLPYLLKDILTQAGVDVFQVELNDINIDFASINSLSFEVEVDAENKKEIIQVLLHDIHLNYQYQSLLQGRLDKAHIGKVELTAVDSKLSNTGVAAAFDGQLETPAENENKTSLVLFKENINSFRSNWHSMIPLDVLRVDAIIFHGDFFAVLDKHQFELSLYPDNNNIHVEIVGGAVNDLHAIKISTHVEDEWSISIDQSKTALLNLYLKDESVEADYFFNAKRMMLFLKKNKVTNTSEFDVTGLFNGAWRFYYNEDASLNNGAYSFFKVHAGQVDVTGNAMDKVRLSDLDVNFKLQYKWLTDYKELSFVENSFINFSEFNYAEIKLKNSPLNLKGVLQIKADKWSYDTDLSIAELALNQKISAEDNTEQVKEVALKNLVANIVVDNKQLKIAGSIEPAIVPALIGYKLKHQIIDGRGDLFLRSEKPFNLTNETSISQIMKPWPYPFDVFSGEMDFDAKLQWSKTRALQLTAKTRLKDVGGVFNELVFSGLSTKQNLRLLPEVESIHSNGQGRIGQTGLIKLDYIDSGVLISDVNLQLALRKPDKGALPVMDVYNFNAELLGGHFSSRRFTLDFNQPTNHLLIHASDLDLKRVTELHQFSGLEIQGLLDGQLPIDIQEDGVFVHEGYFYNGDNQGFIRYKPETGMDQIAANPLSDIALKALRDFRYDKLKAQLSYVPDGTLSIGLEMNGISPDLDNGRHVNLNINTEQNLKALLKSIRFSQGLSDRIDKRVSEKFSATQ